MSDSFARDLRDARRALAGEDELAQVRAEREAAVNGLPQSGIVVEPVERFAAVEEPGADALLGTSDDALIPEDSDAMVYGDGGAGKTTLVDDLAFHLAAGDDWLGIEVERPVRVLVLENEGPRVLFRRKLKRKEGAWQDSSLDGRIQIIAEPWGEATFAEDSWRTDLAAVITEHETDVLIAGPVTKLGMDEAGTIQQVREFMAIVAQVRKESGRRLTVILIHHENKGGKVSGAWEQSGDTLLHVENRGPGHTHVLVQKARWSSEHHGQKWNLAWTDGEGFERQAEQERDYKCLIEALLRDGKWRTVDEVAAPVDKGGIGAGKDTVRDELQGHPSVFAVRKGQAAKEVGRSSNATVYGLTSAQKSDGSDRSDAAGLNSPGRGWSNSPHPHSPRRGGGEVRPAPDADDGSPHRRRQSDLSAGSDEVSR